jgi:hypothetical protein
MAYLIYFIKVISKLDESQIAIVPENEVLVLTGVMVPRNYPEHNNPECNLPESGLA